MSSEPTKRSADTTHGPSGSPRRLPPGYPPDWPSATELDQAPAHARRAPGELPPLPRAVPRGREREAAILDALRRPGPRVVPDETPAPAPPSGRPSPNGYGPALLQWERENRGWLAGSIGRVPVVARQVAVGLVFIVAAFLGGMTAVDQESAELAARSLEQRLTAAQLAVEAREGELALLEIELDRLRTVSAHSASYEIPLDLAEAIYDMAVAEGVDPALGYALIQVESGFYQRAVSPVGAVGLMQLMPSTAFELDPSLRYTDLFRRDTNLRLGFRYLSWLLERYDGDLRLALLAYNRGPGTVDSLRSRGEDPGNGYARAVLSWAARYETGERASVAAGASQR